MGSKFGCYAPWLILTMIALQAIGPPARAQERPPVPAEAGPVPRGIKGARFGMRPAELLAALPGLVEVHELPPEEVTSDGFSASLPGKRIRALTTIGPRRAVCVFTFTTGERLSRIECTIEAGQDRRLFDATWPAILKALRGKYGQATRVAEPYHCEQTHDFFGPEEKCAGLWIWEDRGASLRLEVDRPTYLFEITICNQSPEYDQATELANREVERRLRSHQREQREKSETLARHRRSYDQDL